MIPTRTLWKKSMRTLSAQGKHFSHELTCSQWDTTHNWSRLSVYSADEKMQVSAETPCLSKVAFCIIVDFSAKLEVYGRGVHITIGYIYSLTILKIIFKFEIDPKFSLRTTNLEHVQNYTSASCKLKMKFENFFTENDSKFRPNLFHSLRTGTGKHNLPTVQFPFSWDF
jgi:hypothetical protein